MRVALFTESAEPKGNHFSGVANVNSQLAKIPDYCNYDLQMDIYTYGRTRKDYESNSKKTRIRVYEQMWGHEIFPGLNQDILRWVWPGGRKNLKKALDKNKVKGKAAIQKIFDVIGTNIRWYHQGNSKMLKDALKEDYDLIVAVTQGSAGAEGLRLCYWKDRETPMISFYTTMIPEYYSHTARNWGKKIFLLRNQELEEFVSSHEGLAWTYLEHFHSKEMGMKKVLVPSLDTKILVENKFDCEVEVLGRGIDLDMWKPDFHKTTKPSFVFLGRIHYAHKNLQLLVDTANYFLDYEFTIIGDGPDLDKLKRKINNKNVTFTGKLKGKNLVEMVSKHDINLQTSKLETFNQTANECMAAGLAIFAVDEGATKERIIEGAGIAVSQNNYISELENLLENPKLVQQMRDKALTAKNSAMTWKDFGNKFANILLEFKKRKELIS